MTSASPSLPQFCPAPDILDDLELLRVGAFAPQHDVRPDGALEVHVPAEIAATARAAGGVEIVDPEGVPLVRFEATGRDCECGGLVLAGAPTWIGKPSPRTFERFYLAPGSVSAPDLVAVVVDRPLSTEDLLEIAATAGHRPLCFLVLAGPTLAAHSRTRSGSH